MRKHASWAKYEANAPVVYEEKATRESFHGGLKEIAPQGRRPKPERGDHYEPGCQRQAGGQRLQKSHVQMTPP